MRDTEVDCHSEHINVVLERTLHCALPYKGFPILTSLDDLKKWLVPMIYEDTAKWFGVGSLI